MRTSTFERFRAMVTGQPERYAVELRYGRILASLRNDGWYYVSTFLVYRAWRGKGWARKLAKHLPPKCFLVPEPFDTPTLTLSQLTRFYKSLGFRRVPGSGYLHRDVTKEKRRSAKTRKKAPIRE